MFRFHDVCMYAPFAFYRVNHVSCFPSCWGAVTSWTICNQVLLIMYHSAVYHVSCFYVLLGCVRKLQSGGCLFHAHSMGVLFFVAYAFSVVVLVLGCAERGIWKTRESTSVEPIGGLIHPLYSSVDAS